MRKETKKQKLKRQRHRAKLDQKKEQLQLREKFRNGENVKIKTRIAVPTENEYLEVFESQPFDEKLRKLKSLDLKVVNDSELQLAISEVISYKTRDGHLTSNMMSTHRRIGKEANLFRVRLCEEDPFLTLNTESGAWNPPLIYVKRGRVNSPNESLLYVAEDMDTAIKEMKIQQNQYFWLIVYDLRKDLGVVNVGGAPAPIATDKTLIHNKVSEFLRSEFTREVKPGDECEYRISNIIAKIFYPFEIYNLDGWSYPSVADKGLNSLCLEPIRAKKKLAIRYTIPYKKDENDIIPYYIGFLRESGKFDFEKL